jgi:hypothetical protein
MEKDTIDLSDCLRVIRKQKILIIVGTLICTVAAVVINLRMPERYRAKGLVKIGQQAVQTIKLPPDFILVDNPANVRNHISVLYEQNEDNLKYDLKVEKVDDIRVGVIVEGADMGRAKEILEGIVNKLSEAHFRKTKTTFQFHKAYYKSKREKIKLGIEDLKEDIKLIQENIKQIREEKSFIEKEVEEMEAEKANPKGSEKQINLRMGIVALLEKNWSRSKEIRSKSKEIEKKKRKLLQMISSCQSFENAENEISVLESLDIYKTGVFSEINGEGGEIRTGWKFLRKKNYDGRKEIYRNLKKYKIVNWVTGGIVVEKATARSKNKLFVLAAVVVGFTISSFLVLFIECVRERGEGKKNVV